MMYNDFPRNEFRIMFKDKVKGNGDWDIKLVTNEPLYGEDIIEMIKRYSETLKQKAEDYSPVTIMDEICSDQDGWYWMDGDYDDLHIAIW